MLHKNIKFNVMKKTDIGLLTILGAAVGSFAFWMYSNLSAEEKKNIEDKALALGKTLLDTFKESDLSKKLQ